MGRGGRETKEASGVVVSHHGCSAHTERTSNTIPTAAAAKASTRLCPGQPARRPLGKWLKGFRLSNPAAPFKLMRRLSAYQSWWVWRSRPQYRSWKQERSGQNPLHWRVAVVFGLVWAALVNFSLQSNASPPESIQKETKRLCLGHKNPTKLQVRLWLCFLFKSTTVQSTGNHLKNLTKHHSDWIYFFGCDLDLVQNFVDLR